MNTNGIEADARRLLRAGRGEQPGAPLLDRTLDAVRLQATAGQQLTPGRHRWRLHVQYVFNLRYHLAGGVAVGALACWFVAMQDPVLQQSPVLRAELSAPLTEPEPQVPVPAPSAPASALPVREPVRSTPAPTPPRVPVVERRTLSKRSVPSSAEAAAHQRTQSAEGELAAAAARAVAKAPAPSDCVPKTCETVRPTDSLITDFEDVSDSGVFVDGDAFSRKPSDWWQRFYGSTYVYPEKPSHPGLRGGLSQSIHHRLRVQGRVAGWAGFGFWLGACQVDFSAYRGLSFKLWGKVGPVGPRERGALTLYVDTHENSPAEACRPNVGSCDETRGRCAASFKRLAVSEDPGEPIVVLWNELEGGAPRATPDPAAIIQWRWAFDWQEDGTAAPYAVDVWLDDVRLVR